MVISWFPLRTRTSGAWENRSSQITVWWGSNYRLAICAPVSKESHS